MVNPVICLFLVQGDDCTIGFRGFSICEDGLGKADVTEDGSPWDEAGLVLVDKLVYVLH